MFQSQMTGTLHRSNRVRDMAIQTMQLRSQAKEMIKELDIQSTGSLNVFNTCSRLIGRQSLLFTSTCWVLSPIFSVGLRELPHTVKFISKYWRWDRFRAFRAFGDLGLLWSLLVLEILKCSRAHAHALSFHGMVYGRCPVSQKIKCSHGICCCPMA